MTDSTRPTWAANRRRRVIGALIVAFAALLAGLPTLRGTFVGGDDHRLVLNHVLVNHPSWPHAFKLLTILHRDMYQPIPLLSFSLEFAIAERLNLFENGLDDGAWLFHLTNVLLHALNAVLVWALIYRLQPSGGGASRLVIATVAGVLFAVHPLQVEVIAWVNGRMMLLSMLFATASLLALSSWIGGRGRRWAVAVVTFALFSALSKARVELPALFFLVVWAQGRKPDRRFWTVWVPAALVTVLVCAVNLHATAEAGMFEGAARLLQGPPIVRSLIALAWYVRHFILPVGLASWYPAPATVRWTDGETLRAVAWLTPLAVVWVWSWRRSRVVAWGLAWFLCTIVSTLPSVLPRNTLAADRYMYLPIVGFVWITAWGLYKLHALARARYDGNAVRGLSAALGLATLGALTGMSWHVASFYETSPKKLGRVAQLYPSLPQVFERLAWSYHDADKPGMAMEAARKALQTDDPQIRSEAFQVIALSQRKLGKEADAFHSLQQALAADPGNALAEYRLAILLDETGRLDEALPLYESAVAGALRHNPSILKMASVYRRLGRPDSARAMYEKALGNNPYEVPAILGLTELDMEAGTAARISAAEQRLIELLDWMPEHSAARANLGAVWQALGRPAEAIAAYAEALARDPTNLTAALNLAELHLATGDPDRAHFMYHSVAALGPSMVPDILAAEIMENLLGKQYERAVEAASTLASSGEAGETARLRVLRSLELFDQLRSNVSWTFDVAAQLLIAHRQWDAARASLTLLEGNCTEPVCAERARMLRAKLPE